MRTSIPFVVVAAVALGLTVSHSSLAGSRPGAPWAFCGDLGDGTGTKECGGSLAGFMESADPNAAAVFSVDDGYATFNALYHGTWYSCVTWNPSPLWQQAASLPYYASFSIQIGTNGQCVGLGFSNASTN
jgi:hypothetical protein